MLVSFLELYNEDLVDLLNPSKSKKCDVQIREDVNGNIYWAGVREEVCQTPEDLVKNLIKGSLGRTTGSTDMNSVSSRSHAIFSVILKQKLLQEQNEEQVIVSKFHFVDLAGSERVTLHKVTLPYSYVILAKTNQCSRRSRQRRYLY